MTSGMFLRPERIRNIQSVGWVNLNKPSRKVYRAHVMVFYAQFSNFIAFGPEMTQRNNLKVFGLNWPFFQFSLILMLISG